MLQSTPAIKSFIGAKVPGVDDAIVLTLGGTAAADSVVNLFDGNSLLGSVQADATGNWAFITDPLVNSDYAFSALTVDSPPDAGTFPSSVAVTVDTGSASPFSVNEPNWVTVADGATVGIDGAGTQFARFLGDSGTLRIRDSIDFSGQIAGLTGSDTLDLADIRYGTNTQV